MRSDVSFLFSAFDSFSWNVSKSGTHCFDSFFNSPFSTLRNPNMRRWNPAVSSENVCSLSVPTLLLCMRQPPRIRINQIAMPLIWSHKASPYSSLAQQGVLLINVKLSMPWKLEQACGLIKFEENLFYARERRKELWKAGDSVWGINVLHQAYVGRKRKHVDERVRSWLPRLLFSL